MPEPTTPTPPQAPATPSAPSAPVPTPPPAAKQPPWGDDANFNPEEAWKTIQNLRKEKGGDTSALQAQLAEMQAAQQQQRDALATMLGVKPEETSDVDKLAKQIDSMRDQIVKSQREAVAARTGVPENLLTASDPDALQKQADEFLAFAQAAHFAALTSTPPPPPPAFQQNPGQGQGNAPLSPEALAAAEYEKYYPTKK